MSMDKQKKMFGLLWVGLILFGAMAGFTRASANLPADPEISSNLYLPLVFKNARTGSEGGELTGLVFSTVSSEKQPLPGATVCLNGGACVVTGADGRFLFQGLAGGSYQLSSEHPEHFKFNADVVVPTGQSKAYDIGMVGLLAAGDVEMRITVEWLPVEFWSGSICSLYPQGCPADLDAHVWAQYTGYGLHHYEKDMGDCISAGLCLEYVTTAGPGPETAAIRSITDPNSMYYYGVLNYYQIYPGVPNIRNTEAIVRIYKTDGTILSYNVNEVPVGQGNFWYVFSMNAKGQITPQNCLTQLPPETTPYITPPSCTTQ